VRLAERIAYKENMRNAYNILIGNLDYVGIYERIILKWILEE
jgi:hypothetical protein